MSKRTPTVAPSLAATTTTAVPPTPAPANAALPLLVLLFIGSGAAALIYEVVWFQLLSLIVGSSAVSMAVILGTFMGGMCLGSLYLPKYVSAREHPLRVYAKLELGIAVAGAVIFYLLPWIGGLYTAIGGGGMVGVVVRALFCTLFLLPPTLMMGATLPAIARWVQTTPSGVSWLGFFYGGNIFGAVAGAVLAGFYLLRVHDMQFATWAAIVINVVVAGAALLLSGRTSYTAVAEGTATTSLTARPAARVVYFVIALSGMTALAAEGVWTRLVTLMIGGTVYTFSMILAVMLVGLGIGSTVGASIARSARNPRLALGICQLLLVGALGWASWAMMASIPYWPINVQISTSPYFTMQLDLVRCLYAMLPAALLWGASFPLALASVATPGQDPGRLVGTVYAANTLGAIVGSIAGSVMLIPVFGTQDALRILIAFAALSSGIMLLQVARESVGAMARTAVFGVVAAVFAVFMVTSVPALPPLLVMYGRYMATWIGKTGEVVFVGEGVNSSMAVSRFPNGFTSYHNAGKVQASSEPQDMRLQRMLGHLTTLLPTNPSSVLVIGCGAGVTAGAVSVDPNVKKLTIAEIEPLVPEVVSRHFGDYNFHVIDNPKTHLRIDDARHFLNTTDETFDAITSDPFDPWVKGAASLYTKEFWELAKKRLNPGGVVTVFVQLYEAGTPAVKSEIATFLEVFPEGVIFGNTYQGRGYDIVLVGMKDPSPIDVDRVHARLSDPAMAPVAGSLAEIGMMSAFDLLGTYAGKKPDLAPWLADAQLNRDRNLRLQFLAGLGANVYEQAEIYESILQHRQYPEGVFTGKAESLNMLYQTIQMPKN
jgi:spermidine synthase